MTMNHKEEKLFMHMESHEALTKVAELVEARLVDCGWRDQVRMACRKMLLESSEHLTMDAIIAEITPLARSLVPDTVKKELLHELEQVLIHEDKIESPVADSGA